MGEVVHREDGTVDMDSLNALPPEGGPFTDEELAEGFRGLQRMNEFSEGRTVEKELTTSTNPKELWHAFEKFLFLATNERDAHLNERHAIPGLYQRLAQRIAKLEMTEARLTAMGSSPEKIARYALRVDTEAISVDDQRSEIRTVRIVDRRWNRHLKIIDEETGEITPARDNPFESEEDDDKNNGGWEGHDDDPRSKWKFIADPYGDAYITEKKYEEKYEAPDASENGSNTQPVTVDVKGKHGKGEPYVRGRWEGEEIRVERRATEKEVPVFGTEDEREKLAEVLKNIRRKLLAKYNNFSMSDRRRQLRSDVGGHSLIVTTANSDRGARMPTNEDIVISLGRDGSEDHMIYNLPANGQEGESTPEQLTKIQRINKAALIYLLIAKCDDPKEFMKIRNSPAYLNVCQPNSAEEKELFGEEFDKWLDRSDPNCRLGDEKRGFFTKHRNIFNDGENLYVTDVLRAKVVELVGEKEEAEAWSKFFDFGLAAANGGSAHKVIKEDVEHPDKVGTYKEAPVVEGGNVAGDDVKLAHFYLFLLKKFQNEHAGGTMDTQAKDEKIRIMERLAALTLSEDGKDIPFELRLKTSYLQYAQHMGEINENTGFPVDAMNRRSMYEVWLGLDKDDHPEGYRGVALGDLPLEKLDFDNSYNGWLIRELFAGKPAGKSGPGGLLDKFSSVSVNLKSLDVGAWNGFKQEMDVVFSQGDIIVNGEWGPFIKKHGRDYMRVLAAMTEELKWKMDWIWAYALRQYASPDSDAQTSIKQARYLAGFGENNFGTPDSFAEYKDARESKGKYERGEALEKRLSDK